MGELSIGNMVVNYDRIMWPIVNFTAAIGIVVNLIFLYFLIRHKRLRQLSIGGLLMLSAVNDVMLNTFSLSVVPNTIRDWLGVRVSYRVCTAELSCQFVNFLSHWTKLQ